MMSAKRAWQTLGLEPTADRRTVKQAYAKRLKAMDPDSDVAGFLQLREALTMALRLAETAALRGETPSAAQPTLAEAIPVPALAVTAPTVAFDFSQPLAPLANTAPAKADKAVVSRTKLSRLLRRKGDEAQTEELLAAYHGLLADERMEQIDYAEQFEAWLVSQLITQGPNADVLIPLAAARFGWADELNKLRPRSHQLSLAMRSEELRTIAALQQPDHEWHHAYQILQQPAPSALAARDRWEHGRQVRELLNSLRWHHPNLVWDFDPHHVQLWDKVNPGSDVGLSQLFATKQMSWYGSLLLLWISINGLALLWAMRAGSSP